MAKYFDRVRMTTATTGTGTITLGSAATGYRSFASAGVGNGDVVFYTIEDGAAWEVGSGTYTSTGTTLSRTLISSSTGSLLNLSGNAQVFITAPATSLANLTETNTFQANTTIGSGTGAIWADLNGAAGNSRSLFFSTAGSDRWRIAASSTAETGSNAGSDLNIQSYDDTGTFLATPFSINRATGLTTVTRLDVSDYVNSGFEVGTTSGAYVSMQINGSAANGRMLRYKTAGTNRWEVGASNSAESGSNAGSNYDINRYSDAGSYLDTPFRIRRSDGAVLLPFIDPSSKFGSNATSNSYVVVNAVAGGQKALIYQSAGVNRWLFGADNAETGSDAGANFAAYSYTDAGSYKEAPLVINRATGITSLKELALTNKLGIAQGGTSQSTAIRAMAALEGSGRTEVVTAAGTTTLTSSSPTRFRFTGTSTQTVVLPDVTTLVLGTVFEFSMSSTLAANSVTIQSSGLNTVITLDSGVIVRVVSISTTDNTAGGWDYEVIGSQQGWRGRGRAVFDNTPTLLTPNVGDGTTSTFLNMNGAAGQNRTIRFRSNGSSRWLVYTSSEAESGSNAGSTFNIERYDDTGTFLQTALTISRNNGEWQIRTGSNRAVYINPTGNLQLENYANGSSIQHEFMLCRFNSTPANNDFLGAFSFLGMNSAAGSVAYARTVSQIIDTTSGSEDGRMYLQTRLNGVIGSRLQIDPNGTMYGYSGDSMGGGTMAPNYFIQQSSNYTLTSQTAAQKYFNETANGAITLATGTYAVEWLIYVTSMSATSGNATFNVKGNGTAVVNRSALNATGVDAATPTNAATQGGSTSVATTTSMVIAVAGTGAAMAGMIRGIINVSTAGTFIPTIALTTAAAAVVNAGSYMRLQRIGDSTFSVIGPWS